MSVILLTIFWLLISNPMLKSESFETFLPHTATYSVTYDQDITQSH